MPHNIEAEQSVLGSILIDVQAQADIMGIIKESDFYLEAHQNIFKSMQKIYARSVPIDFVTLSDQLDNDKILDKVGGIEYITILSNATPSAANYKYYCDIIKALSVRRKLISAGEDIIKEAYDNENSEELLQRSETAIFDIAEKGSTSALEHVGVPDGAIKHVIDKFDKIAKDPTSINGIPTGFKGFDALTNGLQNSDIIMLAARPGVGKTSFSMNVVVNAAVEHGKKCAVFSLEMSKEQLMQRAICSLARVSMARALKGEMDAEEWKRIWAATKKLEQSGLYVDQSSLSTPADILTKCRRLKAKEGLDLVMIDYIQLMKASSTKSTDNRQNEVTAISRDLKVAAKELNVPIIVLSQLSRSVESRQGDHRPMLSDLRDSGAIEQDADIVLFLYNPEKYNDVEQEDPPGTVELIIAKHRNGSTGTVKLRWVGEFTSFFNLEDKVETVKKKIDINKIEEKPIQNVGNVDVFDD